VVHYNTQQSSSNNIVIRNITYGVGICVGAGVGANVGHAMLALASTVNG